jgi:hypothetical protein
MNASKVKVDATQPDESSLRSTLKALELPPEAIPLFLAHIRNFCESHGGEKHYNELLAMLRPLERIAHPSEEIKHP